MLKVLAVFLCSVYLANGQIAIHNSTDYLNKIIAFINTHRDDFAKFIDSSNPPLETNTGFTIKDYYVPADQSNSGSPDHLSEFIVKFDELLNQTNTEAPVALFADESNSTVPIPDTVDGIVIKDGKTSFCKIFIKELDHNQYQIITPFNIFLTQPFSLIPDESPYTLPIPLRLRRRMYSIRQGDAVSRFLHSPYGQIGFFA